MAAHGSTFDISLAFRLWRALKEMVLLCPEPQLSGAVVSDAKTGQLSERAIDADLTRAHS